MKKAVIYVFSGTGNTLLVSELYKKYLAEVGYETTIHSVKMVNKEYVPFPDPNEFDLVGFGYPVHGFNCPKVMNDFCKLLPNVEGGKKSFILKTSGEGLAFNNYSSQKIIPMLQKKSYEFLTERHYVMPYNMIFRHTPEMVKSEYLYADAYVRSNVKEIAADVHEKVRFSPLKWWFVPIIRIEWIYAQLQGPAMSVNMKKCIKCMKCVKSCPLGNIRFDNGKFKFGTNCALCVCCSFGCPTKAISIGLLNNWRVNGSYNIEKTSASPDVKFPAFGENLRGLHRWLYYKYYRRLDKKLSELGVQVNDQ